MFLVLHLNRKLLISKLTPCSDVYVFFRIKEIYNERNTQGILKNRLFANHGIDYVKQIAVGPSSVGVLLQVCFLLFSIKYLHPLGRRGYQTQYAF